MVLKFLRFALLLVPIFFAVSELGTFSSMALSDGIEVENYSSGTKLQYDLSFSNGELVTPTTTAVVNLPIIEHNVSPDTPTPENSKSESKNTPTVESPTPTATPIPEQNGSTNLPIVIGAAAIIVVVVLAWLFVSYIPNRKEN
jgi:hypothetical protein